MMEILILDKSWVKEADTHHKVHSLRAVTFLRGQWTLDNAGSYNNGNLDRAKDDGISDSDGGDGNRVRYVSFMYA